MYRIYHSTEWHSKKRWKIIKFVFDQIKYSVILFAFLTEFSELKFSFDLFIYLFIDEYSHL